MSTDLMNVSAFKGLAPAGAFKVLDPHSESLSDGIGSSYGVISYKGKVWGLRLRGENHMFVRPDDGSPAAFLDVIVLRSPPYKSKSYYPTGTFLDGQIGTRPTCAALDGATPDADILTPQSNSCAVCPRNVFKVNPEGRKTRECSDYKRLAVLIVPSMTKALLGAPLMEPVFLRVPAASLNDLALLGEGMSAQGFHFSSYITRIGFNPEKPHPQMTFRALQPLTDREAPLVLPMREDATALRITGENDVGKARPIAIGVAHPAPATATVVDLAAVKAAADAKTAAEAAAAKVLADKAAADKATAEAAAAATTIDTGFGDMMDTGSTQPVATQPVTAAVNGATMVDAGFGSVTDPTPATPATATMNTVSDTGAPEDADADLDARILALLPK